jgi:hypothetical protein
MPFHAAAPSGVAIVHFMFGKRCSKNGATCRRISCSGSNQAK